MKKTIFLLSFLLWGVSIFGQDTIYLAPNLSLDSIKTSTLYAWVNTRISTDNFPIVSPDTGRYVIMKVFSFGRHMTREKVIKKMTKEGYRAANIFELYAYHKSDSNLQYCCPLVALGSSYWGIWNATDYPYIKYMDDSYEFSLVPYSLNVRRPGFLKRCYFLGVKDIDY